MHVTWLYFRCFLILDNSYTYFSISEDTGENMCESILRSICYLNAWQYQTSNWLLPNCHSKIRLVMHYLSVHSNFKNSSWCHISFWHIYITLEVDSSSEIRAKLLVGKFVVENAYQETQKQRIYLTGEQRWLVFINPTWKWVNAVFTLPYLNGNGTSI